MSPRQHNAGFLIIEIIVTVSVVMVVLSSILTLYSFILNNERRENDKLKANLYAEEALEAVDFIARYDWNAMADGVWHPVWGSDHWELATSTELLENRFTRSITIGPVERASASNGHAYGEIVPSGGTNDPETKLVTVSLDWTQSVFGPRNLTYEMYQARDESFLMDQVDWSGGPGQEPFLDASLFSNGANVDYSAPGVLALAGNFISWDNASTTAEQNLVGNVDATSIFVLGERLYIGTMNNSPAAEPELYIYDISSLSNPLRLGEKNMGDSVNGIYVDGDYAALATAANAGELQIYNISNPASITLVKNIDLPSNSDALDVDVTNGLLYVAQGSTLYIYDYSDPANPVQKDSLVLGVGVLQEISAQGSRVYVASDIYTAELTIVDVTIPTDISIIGTYDLPGNRQAISVYAFGFYAYVGTTNDGSAPEFYMIRISNPAQPVLAGTYEVGEKLETVSALSNFAFVGSNLAGDDILVLDVTNPASITLDTGYNIKGTASAVYPTPEAIYLATTSNDSELIIISVNSTISLYPSDGYVESSTVDMRSASSTVNWVKWIGAISTKTAIKVQIATNDDGSTWVYRGPDGTSATYYSLKSRQLVEYLSHLNDRYLRYKVFLETTDNETTPLLYEVHVSYSR